MRKVLLNKSKSKESVNNTNVIPVKLNRDASLFHDEQIIDTVDTMQVYNEEKNRCTKHRFIFTLYPICSNCLFNNLTEIVLKEGSSDAKIVTNDNQISLPSGKISSAPFNRIQGIRNTEYSNEKFGLTYHCGADIFNNHLLRMKDPVSVQKRGNNAKRRCIVYDGDTDTQLNPPIEDTFNTIGDYMRDYNGNDLITHFPTNVDYIYNNGIGTTGNTPLYMYDSIHSFTDTYKNGLQRKDGWVGFINPCTLKIPVSGTTSNGYFINKCINNKEGCEFINLAPEKDLFYFTPKKNPYRKRLEYNWDCFLTYPASSVYADKHLLVGKGKGLPLIAFNIIGSDGRIYLEQYGNNGIQNALFRSPVKHNLKVGDFINLKLSNEKNIRCRINGLGSSEGKYVDRYFSVRLDDFINEISDSVKPVRFAKVVNGFECEYYFRKFKKFSGDYKSTINRLAFANTIYGDEVSQLVFTDDFDIYGYKDNRGRPLTEVCLTILKTNKGYTKWYQENDASSEEIEYSHVFGMVTSGLDMPTYAGKELPTLRYQHNVPSVYANQNKDEVVFPESSEKMEDRLGNANFDFYGDLVEFNPITVNETVLEDVKHRFNTAQREVNNVRYNTIFYDEIAGDNYDADRYGTNQVSGSTRIRQYKMNEGYANLAPEGYIYNPHHKIKIAEYSDTVKQMSDTLIDTSNLNIILGHAETGCTITFTTDKNYGLLPYDIVGLQYQPNYTLYKYEVVDYKQNGEVFICNAKLIDDVPTSPRPEDYLVFKHNLEIPSYAYMLPDNTGRHIWRDVLKPTELTFTSDIYDTTFTNGAFYHHANITFPVRRQDPFGTYGMYAKKDGAPLKNNFELPSTEIDISGDEYIIENENTSCF